MQLSIESKLGKKAEKNLPEEYLDLMKVWQTTAYGQVAVEYESYFSGNPAIAALLSTSPCVTKVLDIRTQQFSFVSSNTTDVFGYSRNQFLECGLPFYNEIAHPEDLHKTWKLLKSVWVFMLAVPSENQAQYKFNYDYRIMRPDRKEARILAQNSVLQTDSKGNITHVLGVYSDISHWKKNGQQTASVISSADSSCILFNPEDSNLHKQQTCLSKRELEIVKLMAEGYSSKLIADKLYISFHTVNTHRQKIIEKTRTRNSGELIHFAISHRLI